MPQDLTHVVQIVCLHLRGKHAQLPRLVVDRGRYSAQVSSGLPKTVLDLSSPLTLAWHMEQPVHSNIQQFFNITECNVVINPRIWCGSPATLLMLVM